jgi:nitrite reductase/ring-hydroxylating ferredoxin subunit
VIDRETLTVDRPEPGEVVVVRLPEGAPAREALVMLDETGALRAYTNVCQHVPIPLDAGGRKFLQEEGLLVCATHGALYRRTDGLCVSGPCLGRRLEAVALRVREDGRVELLLTP